MKFFCFAEKRIAFSTFLNLLAIAKGIFIIPKFLEWPFRLLSNYLLYSGEKKAHKAELFSRNFNLL